MKLPLDGFLVDGGDEFGRVLLADSGDEVHLETRVTLGDHGGHVVPSFVVETGAEDHQIEGSNRTVDLRTTDPEIVDAAPDVMARAIFNLLANANKHAPTDTPIDVTVDRATVVVRDHGSGIADTDLPYLFEPFYRAESARSLPGSGLGLALVKQIIDDHNGTITAANHPDGGARFTVTFSAGSPESA